MIKTLDRSTLPPGPRSPAILQQIGTWTRPTAVLERNRAKYGKRYTARFPAQPPFVVLSDPSDIREVLTADPDVLHPGEGARILEPLVGPNSVILLDEEPHLEQRKLMLPAFHGERMRKLEGLMRELAERELGGWAREEEIELHPRLQRLTLEIVLRAVFGLERGARLDELRDLLTKVLAFTESPLSLLPPPPQLLEPLLSRIGPFARFLALLERTSALIAELVDERRRSASADGADVLSMLLGARHDDESPMSGAELRDELVTALVAGHETTASQLSWAFMHISRAPHVKRRLAQEIESGVQDGAYLTATIQETMRMSPVLPNAEPRMVKKDVTIGGVRYPAGMVLVVNAYLVHHDHHIYPDHYLFRPERFLEDEGGAPPGTYTWLPFGGGRRRCLGASFALLEMKVVLHTVLARCDVHPVGSPELARRRSITISPSRGARVVLFDRDHAPRAPSQAAPPRDRSMAHR